MKDVEGALDRVVAAAAAAVRRELADAVPPRPPRPGRSASPAERFDFRQELRRSFASERIAAACAAFAAGQATAVVLSLLIATVAPQTLVVVAAVPAVAAYAASFAAAFFAALTACRNWSALSGAWVAAGLAPWAVLSAESGAVLLWLL